MSGRGRGLRCVPPGNTSIGRSVSGVDATKHEEVIVDKNLRNRTVSYPSPTPSNHTTSQIAPSNTADEVNLKINTNQNLDKNLRGRVVTFLSPSASKQATANTANLSVNTNQILDKKLQIGTQSDPSPKPSSHSTAKTANLSVNTNQNLDKNLRGRVVTYSSPGSSKQGTEKSSTAQTPGGKNLRIRRLQYEKPGLPMQIGPGNVQQIIAPERPSPARTTRQTCHSVGQPSNNANAVPSPQASDSRPESMTESFHGEADNVNDVPHHGFENEGPEDEPLNGDNDNNTHDEEIPHGFEDHNSQELEQQRPSNKQKSRKRGVNRNYRLEREVRARKREEPSNTENFKPQVLMPENEINPVGDWSASFVRELGSLMRQFAPIRVKSWKHILPRKKEEIVQLVMEKYNITGESMHVKKILMAKLQKLYTDWRSKSHIHYKKLGGGTYAKRNPPEHFQDRIPDWIWLCDNIFANKKWQEKSAKYSDNRRNKKYNPRTGSTSFSQKRHELRNTETNASPGAVEFFAIVHTGKDGVIDPAAEEMHMAMKAALAAAGDGDGPVQTEDQIVSEMVSKKSAVVLHNRAITDSGSIHDRANQNAAFSEEFNAIIEEQHTKLVEYENKMKAQDEKIESQRIIIEEQESTVIELQSQQAATTKVVTDMKGELNRIYQLLALRSNAGTGDGDPTISENV